MELTQVMTLTRTLNSAGLDQIEALLTARRINLAGNRKETTVKEGEGPKTEKSDPKRPPVWEREVLKQFPSIQAFGKQNSVDRGKNTQANKLASILSGVAKRGKDLGLTEEGIVTQALVFENEPELLKKLFVLKEGSDEGFDALRQAADGVILPMPAEGRLRILNGLKRSRDAMEGEVLLRLPVRAAVARLDAVEFNDESALTSMPAPFGSAPAVVDGDVVM
jgi:hypothetical protein